MKILDIIDKLQDTFKMYGNVEVDSISIDEGVEVKSDDILDLSEILKK